MGRRRWPGAHVSDGGRVCSGPLLDAPRELCLSLRSPSHSHLPSFFTFCNPLPAMGANLSKALGACPLPHPPTATRDQVAKANQVE